MNDNNEEHDEEGWIAIASEYAQLAESEPPDRNRHGWTPHRACIKDWILAVYVSRHSRTRYDVAFFECEDHHEYERGSAVKAGLMFLLSDAYYHTGRMELTFFGPRRGRKPTTATGHEPSIPHEIEKLSQQLGVHIKSRPKSGQGRNRNSSVSVLSDEAGRSLYARITGFSDQTIRSLEDHGRVDLTRACFIVQRGIWTVEQVEHFSREARIPANLLEGVAQPESRVLFLHDLHVLRLAIMWQRTKRVLEALSSKQPAVVETTKWSANYAEFVADRDLVVNCMGSELKVKAGDVVRALLVPRSREEYRYFRDSDSELATFSGGNLVVVSRDFPGEYAVGLAGGGALVLMLHDSLADIDSDAFRRLARSVSTKRNMPEHDE